MAAQAEFQGRKTYESETSGDLEVALTAFDKSVDCIAVYQAGGRARGGCPCLHYRYFFKDAIRAVYPDPDVPDEVIRAGEAYFIPAGRVLISEGLTKTLEFHPAYAFKQCQDGLERGIAKLYERAKDPSGKAA